MNKKQNKNAGRQAHDTGTPTGPGEVAVPGARPTGDPVPWVWMLQALGGRALRLRVGQRSFRLSSDTVFFLEEVDVRSERVLSAVGEDSGDEDERGLFTYVCGTPDAVAKTLEDLRRSEGRHAVRTEGDGPFHILAN